MNSRVSSEPWRIDATSGNGVKHPASLFSEAKTAAEMDGFRFHIMQLAATCPKGIKRWHAEMSPAIDWRKYATAMASSPMPKRAPATPKAIG